MQPGTVPLASRASRIARLAAYFLYLGTVGFGGPIALAGRMQRDLVETRRWLRSTDYLDGLAFAQLAPGPLAAQLAMYLGYAEGGIAGATAAGLAFVLPSFLMVLALSMAYVAFGGLTWVRVSFYGIAPAVVGIIGVAAVRLGSRVVGRDRLLIVILVIVGTWTALTQREPVTLFVLAGGATMTIRHGRWRGRALMAFAVGAPSVSFASPVMALLVYFGKASLFVFGSGLAIVPFLYGGVVHDRHWLTDAQFIDAVAVAMITPGPVVITVAFIGYLVAGFTGAVAAAIGIFGPVYLTVVAFAPVFRRYSEHAGLRSFVAGVTAAATGAIGGAVTVLAQRSIHGWAGLGIAVAAAAILLRWKVPEPAVIAGGALLGAGAYWMGGLR